MASIFGDDYDKNKDILNPETSLFPIWGAKTTEVTEIPASSDDPQALSLDKMFPLEYSMDPISGGKFILLQEFNGLFKTLTTQLRNQLMYSGCLAYSPQEQIDRGGYPLDALISILYDEFTGNLCTPDTLLALDKIPGISDTERRAKAQRLMVRSLKPDNVDSPLIRGNLFKTWEIVDGVLFGETKEFMVTSVSNGSFPPPPGYLDLGAVDAHKVTYKFIDYPRVKIALDGVGTSSCGHIIKVNDDTFKLTDTRGLFPRVYNNASIQTNPDVRDPGRAFSEVQDDAMGAITGAVTLATAWGEDSSSYGDPTQRVRTCKGFMAVTQIPSNTPNKDRYLWLSDIGKQNCFRTINLYTNYDLYKMSDDENFPNTGGIYGTSLQDSSKPVLMNTLVLDTSEHPKTAHEIRPKNYCVRKYLKV